MMASRKIPFIDLCTDQKKDLAGAILKEVEKVFLSSQFILGEKVNEFEKRFAELSQTRYAVGVNSGLDALILTIRALGIGAGDEVITAPNSFIGSASAISLAGAKPVFVDVDWDYNLNPNLIRQAITSNTKAILPVHLTGNPAKMAEMNALAKEYGLHVIEDAAQSVGALYRSKPTGALGTAGCFSLHPLKNLHVWGDGGVITTDDATLYENLKLQRNHGLRNRDEVDFYSYNSRLDSIQAVVGLAFMELLDEVVERRTENAEYFIEKLKGCSDKMKLPSHQPEAKHAWHVFQIWVDQRAQFQQYLLEKGIETKVHYPIPLHLQKASHYLGYKLGDFPVTEELSRGIVSIPVRENLSQEDRQYIAANIIEYFET